MAASPCSSSACSVSDMYLHGGMGDSNMCQQRFRTIPQTNSMRWSW